MLDYGVIILIGMKFLGLFVVFRDVNIVVLFGLLLWGWGWLFFVKVCVVEGVLKNIVFEVELLLGCILLGKWNVCDF